MVNLYYFVGLIFTDVRTPAHYVLYNQAYFAGLIFMIRQSSAKTTKIGPLENFPLYGILIFLSLLPPSSLPLFNWLVFSSRPSVQSGHSFWSGMVIRSSSSASSLLSRINSSSFWGRSWAMLSYREWCCSSNSSSSSSKLNRLNRLNKDSKLEW